jgi:hypothetical protein
MTPQSILTEILEVFFRQFGIKYKRHDRESLLLTRYYNFRLKYIVCKPRQIRVSSELSNKLSKHKNKDSIFDIFNHTIKGQDINPFQSKDSFNADFHDLLFNDWGIHHLHLCSEKEKTTDYFNRRTGDLLFVRFTDEIAYFLDIKSHKDKNVWSDTDLIRIIQRNWNESIEDKEVKDVTWHPHLNDEEIGKLRKAGLLFGINVDGKSYLLLGHGQATSGDNMMASRLANEISRWIGHNKHLVETDIERFKIELKERLSI